MRLAGEVDIYSVGDMDVKYADPVFILFSIVVHPTTLYNL